MRIEAIVSMANEDVRLEFLAMERSLRAVGCDLPLRVIPFDERTFALPPNAEWWVEPEIVAWLDEHGAHPTMRKYQCLTIGNFHFVDADVVFLRDPGAVMAPHSGVVSACTEWNKPQWTFTTASAAYFAARDTTWQRRMISSGQFGMEDALYDFDALRAAALDPALRSTVLEFPVHEQPGFNLLLFHADAPITNLTLPPHDMQSTWAGDYPGAFEELWSAQPERAPYLIHWAGPALSESRPINRLFLDHLTGDEQATWQEQERARAAREAQRGHWPLWARALSRVVRRADARFDVMWRG